MTRAEIAARIRAAEPRVAWDWRGGSCGTNESVLEVVAAEVERIMHHQQALLDAFVKLERADEIKRPIRFCDGCLTERPATHYCGGCEVYFCLRHADAHNKWSTACVQAKPL